MHLITANLIRARQQDLLRSARPRGPLLRHTSLRHSWPRHRFRRSQPTP